MTRHFATYFDSAYWPKARAMWRSLKRNCGEARMFALCWDDEATAAATEEGMVTLHIGAFLAEWSSYAIDVLPGPRRTLAEHMWTVGPRWVAEVMRRTGGPVTYVDADLFFFGWPGPLLDECTEPAGVVPHNFCGQSPVDGLPIPTRATHEAFGKYNVGLVHFNSREVAEDWASECRTWCFDRLEVPLPDRAGRYGDQKYLDDWPERYGARVFPARMCLGPWGIWNGALMPCGPLGPSWNGDAVISYHFSSYKQTPHGGEQLSRPEYCLTTRHEAILYRPYREALNEP